MTDTETLIARLSSEANTPARPLSPRYWGTWLIGVLIIYAFGTQLYLGLRPDIALQLTRPAFAAEIVLLVVLLLGSTAASVLAMYPDAYQKPRLLLLPYVLFAGLALFIGLQILLPADTRMVMPAHATVAMECVLCIGAVAIIPAVLIFALLRKGASVRQFQAGFFAMLAASTIGCLTLRVAEMNDSMLHIASWHYLPMFIFAAFGTVIGKRLLKW